jgi:dTDP-4-amino-4,6-dideoxygalactose transaminase
VLALQAAGVGQGDEVVLPAMTMVAVANAVAAVGGMPVFVDLAPGGYNPNLDIIEAATTAATKAIIITHTYGVPFPRVWELARLAKARGWCLIEDISECFGVCVEVCSSSLS